VRLPFATNADKRHPKILVADDESHIVKRLKSSLQEAGFLVATTTKRHRLMDMARSEQPDLIILDIHWQIPGGRSPQRDLHGCEIAQALRAEPSLADIPIILLGDKSAWLPPGGQLLGPGMVRWCEDLPLEAATYVFKPFNPQELVSMAKRLLSGDPSKPD
jgi:CheY-like chemotaxis protein